MSLSVGDNVLFNKEFEGEILAYDEEIKGNNYAVKIKAKNGYKLVKAKSTQLELLKERKNVTYNLTVDIDAGEVAKELTKLMENKKGYDIVRP